MWWAAFLIVAMIMQVVFSWMRHTGHEVSLDWIGLYTVIVAIALVGSILNYAMTPAPAWAMLLMGVYILVGVATW